VARNATFTSPNLQYIAAPKSLDNLTDISIDSATDKDLLQYSAAAAKWTDVAALTLPQINDTSSDHQYVFAVSELAADRTVTLPLLTGNDTFVFAAFAATLTNKTLTSPVLNTGVSGSAVLDQDDMSGNSATQLATQQSIKAYVDAQVATEDTLAELNDTTISGPASNDVLQYSGSAWVDRTYAEAGLVSLTGSETLTNKTLTSPVLNGGALTALTDLDMTSGDKTILDTIGSNTLTIGASGTTVTIPGSLTVTGGTTTVSTTNTLIADKLITLNDGGAAASGTAVGIEVEEDSSATGYIKTAADRAGWEIKAPSTAGVLTIDPSANSNTLAFGGSGKTLTISETATIDQDLATTANVTFANLTATGNVALGNAASDTVTVTGTLQGASPLVFEGGSANEYETTLAITDPTADRTWTLPDATDTFVGLATTDSLSNKTLASPVITTGDINTPDIDGGTVDAITSLTVANNVDVGSYTVRASGFLADGLTAGQVVYTGTDGVLSSEAALAYNASTNTLTATNITGTLSTAAQTSVTSLGTLTALTVDNVAINGTTIGHTSDTDLLTLASGIVTVAGEVSMTTLDIGGTNVSSTAAELNILDGVTSTAAELNLLDGSSANSVVNSKAVIYGSSGELAGTLSTAAQANITSVGTLSDLTVSGTSTTIGTVTSGVWQGTDIGVAYGGTGVSTLTDGGILVGSGASAITAMAVLADSEMIVGNGSTDPVAESGATLRTSIGVGTGDSPTFTGLTLSGDLAVNGAVEGISDYQKFTSSGTWTKPATGTIVTVEVIGGGAGGGGGQGGAASTVRSNGNGGGGAARVVMQFDIDDVGSTETVTIGAAGAAGAAGSGADGSVGGAGGDSSFGSKAVGYGGYAGSTSSTGGDGSGWNDTDVGSPHGIGMQGGNGQNNNPGGNSEQGGGGGGGSASNENARGAGSSTLGSGGGGAGSSIHSNNVVYTGSAGGVSGVHTPAQEGGGAAAGVGAVGTAGASVIGRGAGGGGGGGSNSSGTGYAGGAGGAPGGGGGGGGGGTTVGGAGGAGGRGEVRVWTR
tara:strand:- start:2927 stop:6067 length:3141 start_codon:yes stop_codon:yes gene_type:complete